MLAGVAGGLGHIDDLQRARALYEEGMRIAEDAGDSYMVGIYHSGLAEFARETGDLDAAERHIRRALAIGAELGSLFARGRDMRQVGLIELARDDVQQATACFHEALAAMNEVNDPARVFVLVDLAERALARPDEDEFRRLVAEAASVASRTGRPKVLAFIGSRLASTPCAALAEELLDEALLISRRRPQAHNPVAEH